jgi:hypothetical protein
MQDPSIVTDILRVTGKISSDGGSLSTDGTGVVTLNTLIASFLTPSSTASGAIPTPTGAANTISTANVINRVAPSGACTGSILAAGTKNGQIAIVTNEATTVANTITFSTTVATGLVLTNATPTAVVIAAAEAAIFIWFASLNGGNGAWVHVAPIVGD